MDRPIPNYRKGDKFKLSEDALENYGEEYRDKIFTVEQWYDHVVDRMSKKDLHGHMGFDPEGSGGTECLYHSNFPSDLYEWEMVKVLAKER